MQNYYCVAHFGAPRAGLSTVGYTLAGGPRVTDGVADLGGGDYGAAVAFPDAGYAGPITWDTGTQAPVRITGAVNLPPAAAAPPTAAQVAAAVAAGAGAAQTGDVFALLSPMIANHVFTALSLGNAPAGAGVSGGGSGSYPTAAQIAAAVGVVLDAGVPQSGDLYQLLAPMVAGHQFTGGALANTPAPAVGPFPTAAQIASAVSQELGLPGFPQHFAALSITTDGQVALSPAGLDAVTAEPAGPTGQVLNGRQALAIAAAGAAGVILNQQTGNPVLFAANNPNAPRVSAITDTYGNRLNTTITPPA